MQDMQDMRGSAGSALLSAAQVQVLLGVDASTVYRMAADGRLPAVKIGRQWRFRADRIAALLEHEPDGRAITGAAATAADGPAGSGPDRPVALRPDVAGPVISAAAELLGVMMVVTDMTGQPLTEVANPCPRFTAHADDPAVVAACAAEWRTLAEDLDFEPRFAEGRLGFECARAFVRSGSTLVGMVLVGGVAPDDAPASDDLYHLDRRRRTEVLGALRTVALTLSRAATTAPTATAAPQTPGPAPAPQTRSTEGELR